MQDCFAISPLVTSCLGGLTEQPPVILIRDTCKLDRSIPSLIHNESTMNLTITEIGANVRGYAIPDLRRIGEKMELQLAFRNVKIHWEIASRYTQLVLCQILIDHQPQTSVHPGPFR